MLTLQVRQANQPATSVKVQGDIATVGRTQGCDVVVNQPYVSKRHLRVLKGVVLVDMGSSNGTFVDGQKLTEPTLYTGGEIRLGDGDVLLSVRLDESDVDRTASDSGESVETGAATAELGRQLAEARAENEQLTQQMAEILRRMGEMEAMRAAPAPDEGRAAVLQSELSERGAVLDQLRAELELARRELAGKAELAQGLAKLRQELEGARSESAATARELKAARAAVQGNAATSQALEQAKAEAAAAVRELEAVRAEAAGLAESAQELEQARAEAAAAANELEALRAAAAGQAEAAQALEQARAEAAAATSELEALRAAAAEQAEAAQALEQARAEARALREQLAQAQRAASEARPEPRPTAPPSAAAELFIKLQTENSSLKRRMAELESRAGAAAPAAHAPAAHEGAPAKLLQELVELRAQNAALRAQATSAAARPMPVPAAPVLAAPASGTRALYARLAQDDVEGQEPLLDGSAEEFLTVEHFRLVRHVERIVTRLAGDFIQLYHANTMLPDVDGNLRELVARVADPNTDPDARRELLEYFAQLSRWLVASLGAHRKAAAAFAEKLKTDLSESALTEKTPIPALKRLSGQGEAELWRRVGLYLRELTPDMVEDRLEKLARDAALELFGEHGGQGAAASGNPD